MKIGNLDVYGIIYKITNTVNGKVYIGQTTKKRGFNGRYYCKGIGIERVYNYYVSRKNRSEDYNVHLLNSIKKYGQDLFIVDEIFDIAFSKEELDVKEVCWISIYNCIEYGYNNNIGGKTRGSLHNEALRKEIICLNDGKSFMGANEVIKYYNLPTSEDNVTNCCRGVSKSCSNLVFTYKDQYDNMSEKDIKNKLDNIGNKKGSISPFSKQLRCINTQEIFGCLQDASNIYKISKTCICENIKGNQKTAGKHPITGERLQWEYC